MAVQYPANSHHPFDVSSNVILANPLLREPQRDGYSALRSYWKTSREPALVQMPVGCGKSGLMAILPFGHARRRALLVAPNVTIRTSLARAVDPTHSDCFWKRIGVPYHTQFGPFCAVLDGRDVRAGDCEESHFVVANIQQIVASKDRWLKWFAADYFDLVLIDEGHHNAAASWQKVLAKFTDAQIVSLTATPFRSDGQTVVGELVYRYPFTQAMKRGYIKSLKSLTVEPSKIYFTYRDDTRLHTLEEVLQLREDAWFRRGVALAPKCNWDIVRASAQRLLELRKQTGTPHQIIAATCSIEHAAQVNALYAKLGLRTQPIHSQLAAAQRHSILNDLKAGRLDCIVQVEMLGEGFDHPPLSVAAIFRPFASLAPYVQFVGRIMRVLEEAAPEHPANQGWVVSHAGLHVERHWNDFHQLDTADQQFFRDLIRGNATKPRQTAMRFESPDYRVAVEETPNELVSDPNAESPSAPVKRTRKRRQIPPVGAPQALIRTKGNIPAGRPRVIEPSSPGEPRLEIIVYDANPPPPAAADVATFEEPEEVEFVDASLGDDSMLGPQQKRRHLKVALQLACKGAVSEVLRRLNVKSQAWQLFRRVKGVGPGSNYVTVCKLINQRLNAALEMQAGQRSEMTLEHTERALMLLDRIVANIISDLTPK